MRPLYLLGFMFLLGASLTGAPWQDPAFQELRLHLEEVGYQVHSHGVEIDLFQERLQKLEKKIATFNQELQSSQSEKALERRLTNLEKAHETLIGDFKTFKNHLNETTNALAQCQSQLTKIDKQLSSDIQSLKTSLHSMLTLLQTPASSPETYTVQSGDSLGQIALDHKTDIQTLKKLNNLSSDTIYIGQKITLPQR